VDSGNYRLIKNESGPIGRMVTFRTDYCDNPISFTVEPEEAWADGRAQSLALGVPLVLRLGSVEGWHQVLVRQRGGAVVVRSAGAAKPIKGEIVKPPLLTLLPNQ
jgi:hypothetical protein